MISVWHSQQTSFRFNFIKISKKILEKIADKLAYKSRVAKQNLTKNNMFCRKTFK